MILAFAYEHWRPLALAALCLACFIAGRFSVRPAAAPAVHEVAQEHAAEQQHTETADRADVGGWTATTYYFAPDKAAAPEGAAGPSVSTAYGGSTTEGSTMPDVGEIVKMVVERHDPTVIESHSHYVEQATEDHHLELTVTPAAAPGWALQLGFEDVLAARTLRLAARRHLFGPLWVELSAVPMQRSLGVAAAVEW
jgi:hypothetical protein